MLNVVLLIMFGASPPVGAGSPLRDRRKRGAHAGPGATRCSNTHTATYRGYGSGAAVRGVLYTLASVLCGTGAERVSGLLEKAERESRR